MALKTYLLAPNFTFEPDGPIRIGNIIADPFYPAKPLSTPTQLPLTTTHIDSDCSFSKDDNKSLRGSIWAQFLQNVNGNISHRVSKDTLFEYAIDSLETIRIKEDPSDEEVTERVKEPRVQAAIKAGLSGAAPVYMITGLKVAKGFRLNKQVTTSTRKTSISLGIPITGGVRVGADVSDSHSESTSESFQSGSSIIFAYQLHVIARKRWWQKNVGVDIYASKSAFLNTDVEEEEEEGMMARECEISHLLGVAEENEYSPVTTLEARDGEETCSCIAFQEL